MITTSIIIPINEVPTIKHVHIVVDVNIEKNKTGENAKIANTTETTESPNKLSQMSTC